MATLPYGGKEPATDETGEQYASEQSESCNTTAISSKAKLSDEAIAPHTAVNISARIPDQPSEQTQETNPPTGRDHRSNALQHLRITAPNLHDLLTSLKLKSVELANTSNSRGLNWVERVSAWTQHHYVLMDSVGAVALVMLLNRMSVTFFLIVHLMRSSQMRSPHAACWRWLFDAGSPRLARLLCSYCRLCNWCFWDRLRLDIS